MHRVVNVYHVLMFFLVTTGLTLFVYVYIYHGVMLLLFLFLTTSLSLDVLRVCIYHDVMDFFFF